MLYIFGILFAIQIVVGQTLYKYAVDRAKFELTTSFLFSRRMVDFLTSWQFLLGLGFFISASLLGFWLLSRFSFSALQAVTVPIVLGLSYVAGAWLFKDTLTGLNLVGLIVLIVGVVLASLK